jgi:tRNA A37 threonylcarbamoyladenosine modification protein TsaB
MHMTTDRLTMNDESEQLLLAHIERLQRALGEIIAVTARRARSDPDTALAEIDRIAVAALAVAVPRR